MDVYIVLDGPRVVGVSTKLQGAEALRAEWAQELVNCGYRNDAPSVRDAAYATYYDRMRVENHELRDVED